MASSASAAHAAAGPALTPLTPLGVYKPEPLIERFVVLDEAERVIRVCLPPVDAPGLARQATRLLSEYIVRLLDADDVALVVHNALRAISPASWSWSYLQARLGPLMHHKFKVFKAKTDGGGVLTGEFTEEGFFATYFAEFARFLAAASAVRAGDRAGADPVEPAEHSARAVDFPAGLRGDAPTWSAVAGDPPPPLFIVLHDHAGRPQRFNVRTTALYCLDLGTPEVLPELDGELHAGFALPTLPADDACLTRFVPQPCRPMVGPNVYVAPPGAFTAFHLDGGGTIDSGHQTVTGLNEVYMLRRLAPGAAGAAMALLRGPSEYGLHVQAHDEGGKPPWPDAAAIQRVWDAGEKWRGAMSCVRACPCFTRPACRHVPEPPRPLPWRLPAHRQGPAARLSQARAARACRDAPSHARRRRAVARCHPRGDGKRAAAAAARSIRAADDGRQRRRARCAAAPVPVATGGAPRGRPWRVRQHCMGLALHGRHDRCACPVPGLAALRWAAACEGPLTALLLPPLPPVAQTMVDECRTSREWAADNRARGVETLAIVDLCVQQAAVAAYARRLIEPDLIAEREGRKQQRQQARLALGAVVTGGDAAEPASQDGTAEPEQPFNVHPMRVPFSISHVAAAAAVLLGSTMSPVPDPAPPSSNSQRPSLLSLNGAAAMTSPPRSAAAAARVHAASASRLPRVAPALTLLRGASPPQLQGPGAAAASPANPRAAMSAAMLDDGAATSALLDGPAAAPGGAALASLSSGPGGGFRRQDLSGEVASSAYEKLERREAESGAEGAAARLRIIASAASRRVVDAHVSQSLGGGSGVTPFGTEGFKCEVR